MEGGFTLEPDVVEWAGGSISKITTLFAEPRFSRFMQIDGQDVVGKIEEVSHVTMPTGIIKRIAKVSPPIPALLSMCTKAVGEISYVLTQTVNPENGTIVMSIGDVSAIGVKRVTADGKITMKVDPNGIVSFAVVLYLNFTVNMVTNAIYNTIKGYLASSITEQSLATYKYMFEKMSEYMKVQIGIGKGC